MGFTQGRVRKLVEELTKLLSIIYHQLTGAVPKDQKLARIMPINKKYQGTTGLVSLT